MDLSSWIDNILLTEKYIKSQVRRLKRGTKERKKRDKDLNWVRREKKAKIAEYRNTHKDPEIKP